MCTRSDQKACRDEAVAQSDAWQAHTTREAAKAIGQWLEERGRLHMPIHSLTMPELEAMAISAISSWIVLNTNRAKDDPSHAEAVKWLML